MLKHEKHDYLATFGLFLETFLAAEQQQPSNLWKHKKPDYIWEKNPAIFFYVSWFPNCQVAGTWKHVETYENMEIYTRVLLMQVHLSSMLSD